MIRVDGKVICDEEGKQLYTLNGRPMEGCFVTQISETALPLIYGLHAEGASDL